MSEGQSPLMSALEQFDASEANLVKIEKVWAEIEPLLPKGMSFGTSPEFDGLEREYRALAKSLPSIDGFRVDAEVPSPNDVAQAHFDAAELGEPFGFVAADELATAAGRQIADYRYRLQSKRKALVRDALVDIIDGVDQDIRRLLAAHPDEEKAYTLPDDEWASLRARIGQIEVLIGSGPRPARWHDLRRHLRFGMRGDLSDIEKFDWPDVKAGLRATMYGEREPLPITAVDLSDLVSAKPKGPVSQALNWPQIDDEGFERLIFSLISSTEGYENPEWLMRTNAADRGRDLSVTRVVVDPLSGTMRSRVVIQCKHWLAKSVSLDEASKLTAQMALWAEPPVDVLVIATTGRFTADSLDWIERHNQKRVAPRIDMWADSTLENLLSARPDLVASFGLR